MFPSFGCFLICYLITMFVWFFLLLIFQGKHLTALFFLCNLVHQLMTLQSCKQFLLFLPVFLKYLLLHGLVGLMFNAYIVLCVFSFDMLWFVIFPHCLFLLNNLKMVFVCWTFICKLNFVVELIKFIKCLHFVIFSYYKCAVNHKRGLFIIL